MVVLVRKRPTARKKEPVDVLRKTLILAQQIPIVRNSAKYHVTLQQLRPCHDQSLRLGKSPALAKVERPKIDVTRKPVVQSADISVYLSDDP